MNADVMPFREPDDPIPFVLAGGGASPLGAEPRDDSNVAVQELLGVTLDMEGSDLHLTAGTPPAVRVHGDLQRLENYPTLTPEGLRRMLYAILTQKQRERLEQDLELDVSYALPGK